MGVSSCVGVKTVRIGLLGCGGVGQAIVQAADTSGTRLAEAGVGLECVVALVRDLERPRSVSSIPLTTDPLEWRQYDCDVVVEVLEVPLVGRLHDTVQGDEEVADDPAHVRFPP